MLATRCFCSETTAVLVEFEGIGFFGKTCEGLHNFSAEAHLGIPWNPQDLPMHKTRVVAVNIPLSQTAMSTLAASIDVLNQVGILPKSLKQRILQSTLQVFAL